MTLLHGVRQSWCKVGEVNDLQRTHRSGARRGKIWSESESTGGSGISQHPQVAYQVCVPINKSDESQTMIFAILRFFCMNDILGSEGSGELLYVSYLRTAEFFGPSDATVPFLSKRCGLKVRVSPCGEGSRA
jgi:hypothetical protein